MTPTLEHKLQLCEELRNKLYAAAQNLELYCAMTVHTIDREACRNVAGEVRDFLEGAGQRLLARAAAGEEHAADNYLESGAKILEVATGAPADLGRGLSPVDLVREIVEDAANRASNAAPKVAVGFGAVLVGLLALAVVTR